jgi:hypothetical protein
MLKPYKHCEVVISPNARFWDEHKALPTDKAQAIFKNLHIKEYWTYADVKFHEINEFTPKGNEEN